MLEGLPVALLNGIGVVGVVVLFYWMLATGRIATRGEVQRIEHDRDEWRTESRLKDAQIAEKDRQLDHLTEVGETAKAVLGALQRLSNDGVNR